MTDTPPESIPLDAHPGPVLAYAATGEEPVVMATNAAFDAAFDADAVDRPVPSVLRDCGAVEAAGGESLSARLAVGDGTVYVDAADSTYLARVAGEPDDAGYLLFTDLGDAPGGVSVGDVASVLGHDLRNPLDVAKAHLRAAEETGDDEHFAAVADAHDRMTEIIRDVLALARGDRAVDASTEIPTADAAREAWNSVETGDASLRVGDDVPDATGDADRVRRLFENAFRNSVEHGGGDVTVTVDGLGDGEGFFVADDGPGIPADEHEDVFDPGYTTAERGTGLGLAIVERIATAHGWTVDATASDDGGARLDVRF